MTDGGDEKKKAYGTFEGQYQPSIGFPQPIPPPGLSASPGTPSPYYPPPHGGGPSSGYPHGGYQAVQGYAVVEGRPVRERRLPCCGIGIGWLLFLLGFVIAGIPWYVGALIIAFGHVDHREKPGYVACTIAAVLATIAGICGLTKGLDDW
ncbi:hypothetical protein ACHQM5_004503 [Ranunculus cassubicifolius]